jgi:hypothetical protein
MRFRRYAILIAAAAAVIAVAAGFRFTDDALLPPQGIVGQPYFHKIDLEGGCKGKVVTVGPGNLPPGLQLVGSEDDLSDGSNWRIQGTPTQAGSWNFGLTATDICKSSPPYRDFTITILPKITVTSQSLGPGIVGQPYSVQLTATGGSSYTWSVASGTLPPGLTLSTSGLLAGTPTTVGASAFTVQAREGTRSDTTALTLTVVEQLVASTPSLLARGEVTRPYSLAPTAHGGMTPYTWSVASGTLPSGLALDPATGAIRGVPLTAGAFPLQLSVKDSLGLTATVNVALTVARKLTITSTRMPAGIEGRRYSRSIAKVGGVAPFRYRYVGGRLPAGLRLDNQTGRISGIPRRDGIFRITARVTDSLGAISTQPISLVILPA